MPYPYGMYNAPTVGNGLGGLPRRAPSVPAIPSIRYDTEFLTLGSGNSTTSPSSISVPILMNGKGVQYFKNSTNKFRYTFDYSSAGITNEVTTGLTNVAITELPTLASSTQNASNNCVWSHQISDTQTLYKYVNTLPFLVTYTGTGDTSYTQPTVPSGYQFLSSGGESFILPNGNLAVFAYDSASGTTLSLIEYTTTFTQVRIFSLGSAAPTTNYGPPAKMSVRKTRYGYAIGLSMLYGPGNTVYSYAITVDANITRVISSQTKNLPTTATISNNVISIVCGEEGIIFVNATGSSNTVITVNSINFPISSTGIITTLGGSAALYNVNQSSSGAPQLFNNQVAGTLGVGMGCTKYADDSAPTLVSVDNAASQNNTGVILGAKTFSSASSTVEYVDASITPIINGYSNSDNGTLSTLYAGYINKATKSSWSTTWSFIGSANLAFDNNGFIYISAAQGGGTSPMLLRKVSR